MTNKKYRNLIFYFLCFLICVYFYKEKSIDKIYKKHNLSQIFFILLFISPFCNFLFSKFSNLKTEKKFLKFIFTEFLLILLIKTLKLIFRKKRPDHISRLLKIEKSFFQNLKKEEIINFETQKDAFLNFLDKKNFSFSFPSLHAAISMHSLIFLNMNLQSNFKKKLFWLVFFIANVERLIFNKHRGMDLIAGHICSIFVYEMF